MSTRETHPFLAMDTERFEYDLPTERIAQRPAAKRDDSRLLVIHRSNGNIEHRRFKDLPDYCGPSESFFRNTARVLPARLFGQRRTGGQVECLLLRKADSEITRVMERPGGVSSNQDASFLSGVYSGSTERLRPR